eukprot:m.168879 g.168879  ORF g.168879 m.168879 type:complete len:111 (-) comp25091_c0_seq3:608-940(-)
MLVTPTESFRRRERRHSGMLRPHVQDRTALRWQSIFLQFVDKIMELLCVNKKVPINRATEVKLKLIYLRQRLFAKACPGIVVNGIIVAIVCHEFVCGQAGDEKSITATMC